LQISFISDTHKLHKQLTNDLKGGDILIHTGDISSHIKYVSTMLIVKDFVKWFADLPYTYKIFIGGNHDFALEKNDEAVHQLCKEYNNVYYLNNELLTLTIHN
jgi:predicted phosphohydrolase